MSMRTVPHPAESDKHDPGARHRQLPLKLVKQRAAVDVVRIA